MSKRNFVLVALNARNKVMKTSPYQPAKMPVVVLTIKNVPTSPYFPAKLPGTVQVKSLSPYHPAKYEDSIDR